MREAGCKTLRMVVSMLLLMPRLVMAAAPPATSTDDLTTMTPEQRRAYLEQYLKQLQPTEPTAQTPASVPVEQPPAPAQVMPPREAVAPEPAVSKAVPPVLVPEPVLQPLPQLDCIGMPPNANPLAWVFQPVDAADESPRVLKRSHSDLQGRYGVVVQAGDRYFLEQRCTNSAVSPVRYAELKYLSDRIEVETGPDTVLTGVAVVPSSEGFLLDQGDALIRGRMGELPSRVRIPAGYRVAEVQNADVGSNQLVMLISRQVLNPLFRFGFFRDFLRERDDDGREVNNSTPALLFQLQTGRAWELALPLSALRWSVGRQCSTDAWANGRSCGMTDDAALLMREDGAGPELASYAWRASWVASSHGFELMLFDPDKQAVSVTSADGQISYVQNTPKKATGAWWRPGQLRPTLVLDFSRATLKK